jgi:nitrate reductase (NAD(P)H)
MSPETNNSPSAFNYVAITPFTALMSFAGSPRPASQNLQAGLPMLFFPASLSQLERNGPQLPRCLPQLPNNVTPRDVAEQVMFEILARSV